MEARVLELLDRRDESAKRVFDPANMFPSMWQEQSASLQGSLLFSGKFFRGSVERLMRVQATERLQDDM